MKLPYLIDTHCHLSFEAYQDDVDAVIERALEKNIWMVSVATQLDTATRARELSDTYDGVFFTAGIHPVQLGDERIVEDTPETKTDFQPKGEQFDEDAYKELISHPKCVAIGEIGLDYFHLPDSNVEEYKSHQKNQFKQQLVFAAENNKPVYLHCRARQELSSQAMRAGREAYDDLLEVLTEVKSEFPNLTGVAHFFAGTIEHAKQLIEMDFYISFTGVITFTHDYDEVIKSIPLERILTETDAPFVAPAPHRGKRNEPSYVEYVAEALSKIYDTTQKRITQETTANATKLLGI